MSLSSDCSYDVAIAGAGPTGLFLACELALQGVRAIVLERSESPFPHCRAFNLNVRSLECLDRRGILDRFIAEGAGRPITGFGGLDAPLSLKGLDTDHPYTLGIPQTRVEELLWARADELGAQIRWGHEVVDLSQTPGAVTLEVSGPRGRYTLHPAYVAGCDGGRSTVRKRAGIAFPGTPATRWALLGDVELKEPLSFGQHRSERGGVFVIPRPGYVRLITADSAPPKNPDEPVQLEQLEDAVSIVLGRRIRVKEARWLTRFGNAARQAERYVSGRVVLAGDAAHIHPPAGAQGLNVGLQDAFNLGWKLAGCVQGWAPSGLLQTYHTERHAAGAEILMNTRAQELLGGTDDAVDPLRRLFSRVAEVDSVQRLLAEMVTGVGTRCELGSGHSALGRMLPNARVRTETRETSFAELLHSGAAVLWDGAGDEQARDCVRWWAPRVKYLAGTSSEWAGCVMLLRGDGVLAWIKTPDGDAHPEPLDAALRRWFGEPEE